MAFLPCPAALLVPLSPYFCFRELLKKKDDGLSPIASNQVKYLIYVVLLNVILMFAILATLFHINAGD